MTRRGALAAAVLVVACGKGTSSAPEKDPAPAPAPAIDGGAAAPSGTAVVIGSRAGAPVPAPFWADRPEPALRALGAALEAVDTRGLKEWLRRRELPVPDGEPPPPPPADVQAAIDALVAWDGSGVAAPMPCRSGMGEKLSLPLLLVVQAAFEVASTPGDPPSHAGLRMGLALRADDNTDLAMSIGATIPDKAVAAFARRGTPAVVAAPFAVAEDLPWRVLASSARCVVWSLETFDASSPENAELLAGLARAGHDPSRQLAEEARLVTAFWNDTLAQAATVKTHAELEAFLARRIEEARAMRPRSFLTPLLGAPYAAKMVAAADD